MLKIWFKRDRLKLIPRCNRSPSSCQSKNQTWEQPLRKLELVAVQYLLRRDCWRPAQFAPFPGPQYYIGRLASRMLLIAWGSYENLSYLLLKGNLWNNKFSDVNKNIRVGSCGSCCFANATTHLSFSMTLSKHLTTVSPFCYIIVIKMRSHISLTNASIL